MSGAQPAVPEFAVSVGIESAATWALREVLSRAPMLMMLKLMGSARLTLRVVNNPKVSRANIELILILPSDNGQMIRHHCQGVNRAFILGATSAAKLVRLTMRRTPSSYPSSSVSVRAPEADRDPSRCG